MSDMNSESMNWVSRRAKRESVLAIGAPELWSGIRSAIQDACDSFNEHYSPLAPMNTVACKLENGHRVRIMRNVPVNQIYSSSVVQLSAVVTFNKDSMSIQAESEDKSWTFSIDSDENKAFAKMGDRLVTADEISQIVIERVLFPTNERTRPLYRKT